MQHELATYQTYASPRKTGGLIAGISLVTLGIGALVLYLVKQSRKADEEALKELMRGEPVQVYQTEATTIGGLLDELFQFGRGTEGISQSPLIPKEIGCNKKWNKLEDVDEFNPSANFNKCGQGVFEFQEMLNESGYFTSVNGKYDNSTFQAHKQWVATFNEQMNRPVMQASQID